MEKLALFMVSFCLSSSLQDQALTPKSKTESNSSDNVIKPRTFWGIPVVLNDRKSDLNKTENSSSSTASNSSVPELHLRSNQTSWYLQGPVSTKLIPALYISILAVGVPANLFILCSLAFKVRKVSSAILYCSLALSDLLLLLTLVLKAHYHLGGNDWGFGEAACRVITACFYGNLYCSAQTLACISVKRYVAVVHPFLYKGLPKRMCTAWVTLVLWLVFGAALVPELLVRQSYSIPQLHITTCHDILPLGLDSHRFLLYYNLILSISGLLIPLLVSVVCYVRILNELKKSHCDWGLYIRSSSLVFVIFLVCFTPAGILHFVHYVQLYKNGTESLYVYFNIAVCLCCFHAAMDPFLFMLMSRSTGSNPYSRALKSKSFSISV